MRKPIYTQSAAARGLVTQFSNNCKTLNLLDSTVTFAFLPLEHTSRANIV